MTGYRRPAALAAAVAIAFLAGPLPGTPAAAHGAMTSPVSRVAGCGKLPGGAKTAACKAAIGVSGSRGISAWDNLRVAGVNGADRRSIPDGELCSAGKPEYAGLDLPRSDWPTTRLTPGGMFTFRYATTIPHEGTFRLYVTNASYDPAKRLTWSAVERRPFLTVRDPQVTGGAYTFRGRLPASRTGRHLIYAIWQNSSSADTYYSCSDVDFAEPPATPKPNGSTAPAKAPPPADGGPAGTDGVGTIGSAEPVARSKPLGTPGGAALPLVVAGAAMLSAVAAVAVLLRRRRRPDQG